MHLNKSILAFGVLAALGTAQIAAHATVVKTTSGTTTTYSENFNGATSFSAGEFNAPGTSDDFLWLASSQKSTWSFSSATALASVTVDFFYSVPGSDTGFFKFASNSNVALADTNGNAAQFMINNPGASTGGYLNANNFDGSYSATYTNLAAGTYTLSFSTDAADCGSLSGLKVDDLRVTAITAAVPEPETYALLLAGLGAVWFLARRRSVRRD